MPHFLFSILKLPFKITFYLKKKEVMLEWCAVFD